MSIGYRPIFKNKKKTFDDILDSKDVLDEDSLSELDIYDSSKMKEYNEKEDNDLSILDELINGNYKKRKKENKKREKKEKKKQKKEKKKEKKKFKKREGELLDLDQVYSLDEKKITKKQVDRSDEDFYEARFNGTLVILRELLKQVNNQVVTAEQLQQYFKTAKIRGALTALSNQGANISSLLSTKLNIIKEIHNINKTVSDLELKKAKELKDSGADTNNTDFLMNEIFKSVVNDEIDVSNVRGKKPDKDKKSSKKKKKKKQLDSDDMYDIIKEDDELEILPDNEEHAEDYDYDDFDEDDFDNDDDALDARIKQLEEEGEIEFSDTEKAYKYEGRSKVIVVKNPRTDRWKFMAIDENGDEIFDYPLPLKSKGNKMTFDREHGIAKDKLNNIYELQYIDDTDPFYD